jgi:hypothetical protein
MRVRRDYHTDEYTIVLSEPEAMELHEFITDRARHHRPGEETHLEMRIANDLYHCGLIELFKEKWKKEYDL